MKTYDAVGLAAPQIGVPLRWDKYFLLFELWAYEDVLFDCPITWFVHK